MTRMAVPLQYGDPPRLGGFAVQARLSTAPAGLVYLGQAADGRAVSIALLTRGAALDPSARERFVTAIRSASGVRGWVARARNKNTVSDGPTVIAADLGQAPWVAVPYVPGRPGAERFLEPVLVGGTLIGEVHGPDFVPYWLADRTPALPAPPRPRAPLTETRTRVLAAAAVLVLLLLMGAVIALLLFGGDDDSSPMPRPLPPTEFVPSPPPVPVSPEPQEPDSSPSPGETGRSTPGQSPGDDMGESNPI